MDGSDRARLGHGGVAGVLLAIPLAALTLVGVGHTLGPHPAPGSAVTTAAAAACFTPPPAGVPTGLARGYRFLWFFSGAYGDRGQETTWVYNRSCADPDADYPVLVIRITEPGGQVPAGDRRRGQAVHLDGSQTSAVYYRRYLPPVLHTILCTGGYWFPDQKVSCRWDAETVNLLMVESPQGTFAIIGGRDNGIGEDELVSIARGVS